MSELKKYEIKVIIPATIVQTIDMLATDKEIALGLYMNGYGKLLSTITTRHTEDIEYVVTEVETTNLDIINPTI